MMDLQAMRTMSGEDLRSEERGMSEQIFRIRFQASLGNQDGVKKLRQLKKQVAQLKTIQREKVLVRPVHATSQAEMK